MRAFSLYMYLLVLDFFVQPSLTQERKQNEKEHHDPYDSKYNNELVK